MAFVLAHLSDLHWGREIQPPATAGAGLVRGQPGVVTQNTPQGFMPHDPAAVEDLVVRLKKIQLGLKDTPWGLVTSGDLTITGDDSEFSLAQSFLKGEIRRSLNGMPLGLGGLRVAFERSVAGNHDHWGGSKLGALGNSRRPRALYGRYVDGGPSAPWWSEVASVTQSPETLLHVMGIDSCGGYWLKHTATGAIDDAHLRELHRECADVRRRHRHARIVRVLVLHHSLVSTGGSPAAWLHQETHKLAPNSEAHLRAFLQANDVAVMLTGHLHRTALVTAGGVRELRAGTATQYQSRPAGVGTKTGQSFLLHQISVAGTQVEWTVATYERLLGIGFVSAACQRFTV